MRSVFQGGLGVVCFSLMISGCSQTDEGNSQSLPLTDRWQLVGYEEVGGGGQTYPIQLEPDEVYWVEFEEGGTLVAMDACNDCTGEYEKVGSGEIHFSEMSCTEIACAGPQFLVHLNGLYSWEENGDTLSLYQQQVAEGWVFHLVKTD